MSSSSQQPRSFAWTLQSPVFVTCVITLLHSIAFGLVAADAVDLLTHLVKGDLSRAAYLTSWLEATMAALQFIFNPVCGSLSDRWGRRPFILLSLLGTAIEFWLIAWFASIPILIIGAILRGLTGVTYTLTSTVAIDASKNNLDLSANIGLIGAATGLGFIFGAIGGIGASRVSLFFPFIIAGIITFFNTLFAWIWLVDVPIEERERGVVIDDDAAVAETRDTSTYQQDSAVATSSPAAGRLLYVPHAQSATVVVTWNPFSPLRLLVMSNSLLWLSVAYWLTLMARAIVKIWFLYTKYRYHWDAATNGIFIAYVGICLIIAQGLMLRYLVGKFGEHHLIIITICMSVLASICFGVAWEGWQLFVLQSIFGWNYVLIPVLRGVISHHVLPEHQGTLQGALAALVTSATLLGSFIFAQLFGYFTSTSTPIHLPGVPFYLSAILHLISLIFVYIAYRYINANTTYVQIASHDDNNYNNKKNKVDVDDVAEDEHDDHQPLLGEKDEHVRERGNKSSEIITQVPFTTITTTTSTPTRVPATSILRVTIPHESSEIRTSRVQFVPLPSHLHTDRRPSELTHPVIATTPIPPSDDDTRQHEEEMIAAIIERQRHRRNMMHAVECSG